ncbi:hypothetical protein POV27_02845 [Aureisphaera galaxeae]|uniref:hypothetical protein n=1 Tax=Aureisphaera galaxeae TaxID=1538023 RepID=UPI0023506995|nr:hypothetical protein [Aureisphaera galaxeae]MDC8002970.1 hypothetical protein [Aureisphaera galaxeae]
MFTPITRVFLIIVCLTSAVYYYTKEDFIAMSMMLIAGVLFIYGYFKYGTVYAAVQQVKRRNLKKAEVLISKIKNPDKLIKGHKSYYYFTTGLIALEKQELEKSHSDLTQALEIGLRTKNDKSIVLLNLAHIELLRKDHTKASEYIKKVREMDLNPLVESETNRIEKEIKIAEEEE